MPPLSLLTAAGCQHQGRKRECRRPELQYGCHALCAHRLEENLAPAAQKGKRGGRKKRAHLDVGPDHRPATQLDGASIRALLKDRSALLRPRAALAERPAVAVQQQFQINAAGLASFSACSLWCSLIVFTSSHDTAGAPVSDMGTLIDCLMGF